MGVAPPPHQTWSNFQRIFYSSKKFHVHVSYFYMYLMNIYTLLHELACNIVSYCTSGRGIFTSRRRVKMQPMSEIIAIGMLMSVIKCLSSIPEQRLVSSYTKYQVTRRLSASILIKAHCGC